MRTSSVRSRQVAPIINTMGTNNNYFSQAGQDRFVSNILNFQRGGFYVELGAYHPIEISNTYYLDKSLGWKGISFDWADVSELFDNHRSNNTFVHGDATKHDFKNIFLDSDAPKIIDYLQLDLEADTTLACLLTLKDQIFNDYNFKVITYEHDICHTKNPIHRSKSREILEGLGYELVFPDVCNKEPRWVFEDWYVNPELVNKDYIMNLKKSNKDNYTANDLTELSINYEQINYAS